MPRTPKETKPAEPEHATTIRLPESLWRKLRGRAGENGQSANEYIRQLVEAAVAQEKQDRRALA
jgi:plasmid stability protein